MKKTDQMDNEGQWRLVNDEDQTNPMTKDEQTDEAN